jgi:hypothetical protein
MIWWHYLLALVALWNIAPIVVVWCLPVPTRHKLGAARCFLEAAAKGVVDIIPNLTAPVVVPIALLFCKWESEKLPRLFWWWDNNVSMNGDNADWQVVDGVPQPAPYPLEDTPEVRAKNYWLKGHHPRSFLSRYVWLGLRNRGSKLSEALGVSLAPRDHDRELWGTDPIGQGVQGWALYRAGDAYQLHWIKKAGPLEFRASTGYKIWARNQWGVARASVTNITISARRWKWA